MSNINPSPSLTRPQLADRFIYHKDTSDVVPHVQCLCFRTKSKISRAIFCANFDFSRSKARVSLFGAVETLILILKTHVVFSFGSCGLPI